MVGELARETLELELRRDLGLECDGRTRVAAHRVTRRPFVGDEDLGVGELESFDADRAVASLVAPLGERLPDSRQIFAALRPKDLEVRFHGFLDQALCGGS